MKLARAAAALAMTTAMLAGTTLGASAITGGQLDGGRHPNVALIAFYTPQGPSICSASLVAKRVLLTAGHCTAGVVGKVAVTFDEVVVEEPRPDGGWPLLSAADPAVGYTDDDLAGSGYAAGTAHTHPEYSGFTDPANWNDVGVVVLERAVTGVDPVGLAPLHHLDQLTPNVLSKTLFTSVGYGPDLSDTAPQDPASPFIARRFAEAPGQKLTEQVLQVNGNDNDPRGTGGTCIGDSGGPTFQGTYQVALASYSLTGNCRYLTGLQRVDIPVIQDWLATVGVSHPQR